MPPYKPLPSLTDISVDWVLEWLSKNLKLYGEPSERMKQREHVTVNLTPNIRQKLINIVFQQHMYKWSLPKKCLMLELLGDQSTQSIDFTKSGYAYIDEVWHFYRILVSGQMTNLRRLGVICKLKTDSDRKYILDVNNTFYRVFSNMKNLRWVTLNGVGDNVLLGAMGVNCPHLEYLSVAESPRISDEAIASLIIRDTPTDDQRSVLLGDQQIPANPCASSLKTVCMSETNVTLVSVAILLHFAPKFESFGGNVHAGSITNVIKDLHAKDGHRSFKLQELWEARILPQQASFLNEVCPHLTRVNTDASSLDSLQNFTSTCSLTLSLYYQNYENAIYDYLLESGEKLRELILVDHINCYLDLPWLAELTPNLETLEASITIEEGAEMLKWPSLKTARVTLESSRVLHAFLSNTSGMKDVDITFVRQPYQETFECINDDLLVCILVNGGLKNLQRLKINESAIGIKGIECLLLHCPDLTYIAPVAFWHGLSEQDICSLVERIKMNNWLLKIVMRTDWEDSSVPQL